MFAWSDGITVAASWSSVEVDVRAADCVMSDSASAVCTGVPSALACTSSEAKLTAA